MRATTKWLPVPGFEGWYEISSDGQVRSVDRKFQDSSGRPVHRRSKLLKQHNGTVMLGKEGTRNYKYVKTLMKETFGDLTDCKLSQTPPTFEQRGGWKCRLSKFFRNLADRLD